MIELLSGYKHKPEHSYDFWIDRRSPVGNPFPMRTENERNTVCNKYENYFKTKVSQEGQYNTPFMKYLLQMKESHIKHGKLRLFCWCAPRRCHGLTIIQWLEKNI